MNPYALELFSHATESCRTASSPSSLLASMFLPTADRPTCIGNMWFLWICGTT